MSRLVWLILAAVLAGAASPPPAAPARVFISPFGQPFWPRAGGPDGFEIWFRSVAGHSDRIDRAQFRADATAVFHRLDTNADGVIDGFEIAAYEKSVAAILDIDGQGFAAGGKGKVEAASLLDDPEPVSSADTALNSHITLAEWLAAADHRFDILDDKHKGWLDHDALLAKLPDWARKP